MVGSQAAAAVGKSSGKWGEMNRVVKLACNVARFYLLACQHHMQVY